MSSNYPGKVLEECCSAGFICDATGAVLWCNSTFQELFTPSPPPGKLADFLGRDSIRRILATLHYLAFEIEDACPEIARIRPTAVVIGTAQADPDRLAHLVWLQPVPTQDRHLRAREEYLASIAHDLKNPLGAIFGYADILLDTAAGQGLDRRQREMIMRIRNTSLRTVDLVKNYQYLIALNEDPGLIKNSRSDLNAVIRAVVETTWREQESGVALKLDLQSGELLVRNERSELERIVSNLFGNALKYTPAGGEVSVHSSSRAREIFFQIHNYPAFIPPEEQAVVFERFSRGQQGQEVAGAGLGLYIVKTILQKAGGSISLESSKEKGTTFSVILPAAAQVLSPPPS